MIIPLLQIRQHRHRHLVVRALQDITVQEMTEDIDIQIVTQLMLQDAVQIKIV